MTALNAFIQTLLCPAWAALGVACGAAAAFYGCGRLLLFRFRSPAHLTAFALGTAVLMTVFALLPPCRWALFALLLPFAVWGAWLLFREIPRHPGTCGAWALIFIASAGSALMLPYAWDEQTYQLALPVRALLEGHGGPFPDNPYSFYPALTGRFFAGLIRMGGLQTPRLVVSLITPALAAAVWHQLRRFGTFPAWLGAAAFLLSPLTLALNRGVYVENFIALFTLAGLAAAWNFPRENAPVEALVCGILAGAAAAVKPTGLVGALAVGLVFAGRCRNWKLLLCSGAAAFLCCFFWYLRTFLLTGNFFYPYTFAPAPGSVEHFHYLLGSHRYGLDGLPGLALNWLFVGFYGKIFDGIVAGIQFPFFAICAAAGAYLELKKAPEKGKRLLFPFAAAVGSCAVWSWCFPQSRFLMPLLAPAVMAGAAALSRLPGRKVWYAAAALVLAAGTVFQSILPLKHYYVSWRILGGVYRDPARGLALLTRDPGYFQAAARLAAITPADARVLLLFERRSLYIPRRCRLAVPGFEPTLTPVPENPEKLFEKIRSFDYIMVGETTRDVDLQSANEEACREVLFQLEKLWEQGRVRFLPGPGYRLFQITKKEREK